MIMEYIMLFLQIVILCAIGFFAIGKFLKSNNTQQTALPPEFLKWKQEAQDIILEMDKAGKEIVENVDNKIKIIKGLILDVENKIQEVNKKIIELESKINLKDKEDKLSKINILSNLSKENMVEDIKEEIIQEGFMDDKYDRIHTLALQGWNITDIAKEVQVGKGEVQLILDLKKQ